MSFIKLLATSISICIDTNNNILKILLYDYAKTKLSKKQLYLLYCYISNMDKEAQLYIIMHKWISNNPDTIIKQFLKL